MSNNSNDENGCLVLIICIIFPPAIILFLIEMYNKSNNLKIKQLTEMENQNDLLKKQLDPTFKTREEIKIEKQVIRNKEREIEKAKNIKKEIKNYNLIDSLDVLANYSFKRSIFQGQRDYYTKRNLPIPPELKTKIEIMQEKLKKQVIIKIKSLKKFKETHVNFQNIFLSFLFISLLFTIFYFGFYIQS